MSNATVNLPLVKSGYVRQDYPTTVFPTNSSAEYEVNNWPYSGTRIEKILYFAFQAISKELYE